MAGDRARDENVTGARAIMPGSTARTLRNTAFDVDGDDLVPGVGVALGRVTRHVEPGIGEEHVDPAEGRERGRDHRLDIGGPGEVAGKDEGVRRTDLRLDRREALGRAGGEGDGRPGRRDGAGECAADAPNSPR